MLRRSASVSTASPVTTYSNEHSWIHCCVLQFVAVCCSVLQCVECVAVGCSVLNRIKYENRELIAVCCSVLQCVESNKVCAFKQSLQYVAACCSVLQRVAACCSVLNRIKYAHSRSHYSMLQRVESVADCWIQLSMRIREIILAKNRGNCRYLSI